MASPKSDKDTGGDADDDSTRVAGPAIPKPAGAKDPASADETVVWAGLVSAPLPLAPQTKMPETDIELPSEPRTGDTPMSQSAGGGLAGTGSDSLPNATPSSDSITGLPSKRVAAEDANAAGLETTVRQVGRYLIESRMGRGGMATVYRAHDPQIGRPLAIKFLHASMAEDEECHARFLREARAAGNLQHPNIVAVFDVGEIESRPYMAMELVDGQPLSDLLEKNKQLPLQDAILIALQLARALDYAHTRGVIHRDIKPGNIMLLADGKTVKVTDFGIAHMDEGENQRTRLGAVLGTPQYMSPEQTRGEKLDGRSDLFSAGIVLYQMLTGERPFRGDSLVAVATKIATEKPAPLAQFRSDVPPALRRVVDHCLAKLPAQRFASGKEMADALVKLLADMKESSREENQPRILPLRVKWALAMASIIALVMAVTATLVTQRQYAALMGQATEYGASLARFIARQNAASALSEDWEVVDVAVQEMMKTGNFERIVFIDRLGQVRASSMHSLLGKPYKPEGLESLGQRTDGTAVSRFQSGDASVLGFEAPVTFQNAPVGRVALGIPEKPLSQVAQLSITLMIILALVTVAAVAVAMYFLADWFAKPIRLVSDSLREIGKGNFTHRIGERRKDEFGQLYVDFDAMAQALQIREGTELPKAETNSVDPTSPPAVPVPSDEPGDEEHPTLVIDRQVTPSKR